MYKIEQYKGVLDACFLIDWADYSRNEILKNIFKKIVVSDEVWKEIVSEHAAELLGLWYAEGFFHKVIMTGEEMREVDELLIKSYEHPEIGGLHKAEATAIVYARRRGFNIVLSENKGVKRVTSNIEEYKPITIWGAIDILKEAMIRNFLQVENENDFDFYLDEYSEQTKHWFKKRTREEYKRDVLNILRAQKHI